MYLQADGDTFVDTDEIIGIFDMDNTTVSRQGRGFLPHAEREGLIANSTEELPKSYIVTENKIYISPLSSRALAKRTE